MDEDIIRMTQNELIKEIVQILEISEEPCVNYNGSMTFKREHYIELYEHIFNEKPINMSIKQIMRRLEKFDNINFDGEQQFHKTDYEQILQLLRTGVGDVKERTLVKRGTISISDVFPENYTEERMEKELRGKFEERTKGIDIKVLNEHME